MIDWSPVWISLKTGVLTILITFFLGIFAAFGVWSIRSPKARMVVDGLLNLPLVLPPTVMGFFLLYLFGNNGVIGSVVLNVFGFKIAFSFAATVIAAVAISFPLMYRSALSAFESVHTDLVQAGKTLGFSSFQIFRYILIPQSLASLVGGGILAFARGLGEFGATSMLAGNIAGKTRTLPLAVYSSVMSGKMDEAGWYVAVIVAICFAAVIAMNWIQIRTMKKRREQ